MRSQSTHAGPRLSEGIFPPDTCRPTGGPGQEPMSRAATSCWVTCVHVAWVEEMKGSVGHAGESLGRWGFCLFSLLPACLRLRRTMAVLMAALLDVTHAALPSSGMQPWLCSQVMHTSCS